jgi:TFIIH basal transcription factor complex TTD-A subunit
MRAVKGVLLTWSVFALETNNIDLTNTESDIAVKQILLAKNQEQNFMIEDLDDYHVLIKPEEEERVRRMLDTEVSLFLPFIHKDVDNFVQLEKNTYSLDG